MLSGLSVTTASAAGFDHRPWDQLLKSHVEMQREGRASVVDYDGLSREHDDLKAYLEALSQVTEAEFDHWSSDEQLAFLINAYNAWTAELILRAWPDLKSIKDLGSLLNSPWKQEFIPLLGQTRSLDDIEHHLIRSSDRYHDPRVHFAVNCASIGCPALRAEAYSAAMLDRQLEEQTHRFLADRTRNRPEGVVLKVSPIFKWYRQDFEKGWRGLHDLNAFFERHAAALALSTEQLAALKSNSIDIEFLDYDWRLNAAG